MNQPGVTLWQLGSRLLDTGLATTAVDPSTGHGEEWGKAAPVALLMIVLLGVALYLLIKSMNRQLKKVPESFDPPADVTEQITQDSAAVPALRTDSGAGSSPDNGEDSPGGAATPR